MDNRNFSGFLEKIMHSRQLGVSALSSKLKLKNRNVLMRILNNKATSGTLLNFAETLKKHLDLTDEELKLLDVALAHEQIPDSVIASRKTLSYLFRKNKPEFKNEILCVLRNTVLCDNEFYMGDDIVSIFTSSPDDNFEIHIEDINTVAFVQALMRVLHSERTGKIVIYQYFTDTEDANENMLQIYSLLSFSGHIDYFPYVMPSTVHSSKQISIRNTTKQISHLLKVFDPKHFTHMDVDASQFGIYEQIPVFFEIFKKNFQPLKFSFNSAIDELPDFIKKMSAFDCIPSYEIKSTPCFMLIPFEIQMKLFEDSNYLGYGFDHPAIQKLYPMINDRQSKIESASAEKHFIYSKEGLSSFIKTGKTSDYLPQLRPLTEDESKATLKRILDNEKFIPHLFKEDFQITNVECILFEGAYLSICDPSKGYWDNYSEIGIKNKKMLRIMRDFLIEEIIKNCCHSPEESRRIIEEIIK